MIDAQLLRLVTADLQLLLHLQWGRCPVTGLHNSRILPNDVRVDRVILLSLRCFRCDAMHVYLSALVCAFLLMSGCSPVQDRFLMNHDVPVVRETILLI